MKISIIPCLIVLNGTIFSSAAYAQSPQQKIAQSFQTFLADPQTKYAISSLCVLDAKTGKLVYGKNENIGLAPASTLKTITAATAFSLLGKDFHYQTTLGYSGTIVNGVLKGDLLISGGGDPTLASWRYEKGKENTILQQWVAAIKAAGITRVEGRVIGDDSAWDSQGTPDGWSWQDIGNYYGAGASALSWRENQFDIKLRAGNKVAVVKTVPAMPYLQVVNELKSGAAGSGDNAYVFLPPLGKVAYLRGSWAIGIAKQGISAALPDPAFEAAFRLQDTLLQAGISCSGQALTSRGLLADEMPVPVMQQKISTVTSPALSEIVYWLNKKSVNLYAENLLKTLAWKSGQAVSTANGIREELNYWADKGIDKKAMNVVDGSGLSPANRITTMAMAAILFQIQKTAWFPDFYKSLPENNGMKLKSGTIADVSAFAGYYTADNGQSYVIVINVNNYSGSGINAKLFRVLDALK